METLRTKIREDLEGRAKAESEHHVRGELVKKLVEEHKFEVPQSLGDHQTNQRLQDAARQMMQQGIDPRNEQINWEGAREELRPQAEDDVRATMLMEKIAEAENITISNEEIEEEIESIASAARQTKEQVRAALTKNGGERSIAHRLRNRKALDVLVENARITDAEWTEPKEEDDAPKDE